MECGDQREVSSRQPSPNQTLADVANDICAAVKQEQEADQAMSSEMSMSLMSSKSTAGGTKSSDFPATVMSNILALAAETLQMKTTSTSSSIITAQPSVYANSQGIPPVAFPVSLPQTVLTPATTNFVFTQPQQLSAGQQSQPQLLMAGSSASQTAGLPIQQILVPINQQQINSNTGGQVQQQYITIPAQSIQILANPPVIAAQNLPQFTMLPGQPVVGSNQGTKPPEGATSLANVAPIVPQIIISAAGHTILPTPQLHQSTLSQYQIQQHLQTHSTQESTTPSSDHGNQITKYLPSIQSLTSSLAVDQSTVAADSTGTNVSVTSSNFDTHSPTGANETLVSHTEPGCVIDGIILDDIKEFARQFKSRRLSMGLTQTQVGQALSAAEGPAYSQSAICRFEKLDITPKSAQKIKPVLERWLVEAETKHKLGGSSINETSSIERSKKRKRRTSFTPQSVDMLSEYFNKNSHPSGSEMTMLATQLGYEREVIRVWFCNKRQALKNAAKRNKSDDNTTDITPSSLV